MFTNQLQKLMAMSKSKKTKMGFEQRVCQIAALMVFLMSAAFFGFGFHNLPILESYVALFFINVVMLISHIARNGIKNFFLTRTS